MGRIWGFSKQVFDGKLDLDGTLEKLCVCESGLYHLWLTLYFNQTQTRDNVIVNQIDSAGEQLQHGAGKLHHVQKFEMVGSIHTIFSSCVSFQQINIVDVSFNL